MTSSNGTTTFGYITENSGLLPAPIKLSEGYQDENGKGYGLVHINENHGKQIRKVGFDSVEDFVSFVAQNYDEDNIKVGKSRVKNGNTTYLIQVIDQYDNTLYIELSRDGSYWNVNSGGVFRKGYANKKETVVKTEPQQPNNAVSTGSSLSAKDKSGISTAEPNGEPTVSNDKDTTNPQTSNNLQQKIAQTTSPAQQDLPSEGRVPQAMDNPQQATGAVGGEQQPTNNNRLQRRETSPPNQTLRCSCDGELTPKTNFRTKKRISTRNRGTAERRSLHCRFKS